MALVFSPQHQVYPLLQNNEVISFAGLPHLTIIYNWKTLKISNGFWFTLKIGNLRTLAGDEKLNIHPKPLWELDFTNLCVFTSNPFQWNPTCLQSFWMDFCFQNCNHYVFSHIKEQTNSQKRNPNPHICKIFLFPCSVRLPDQQCPVDRRHKKFGHHGHHTITLPLKIFKKL